MINSFSGAPIAPGGSAGAYRDGLGALLARTAEALRTTDLALLAPGRDRPARTLDPR